MAARRLQAAERQQDAVADLVAIGVSQVSRVWLGRSFRALAALLRLLKLQAATVGVAYVEEALAEQGVTAPIVAEVDPGAFAIQTAAGGDVESFLEAAASLAELEMAIVTEINDAARVAAGVSTVARPLLGGYVRHVVVPCCSRCAILAGRFYRWSDGFQRHPNCRCFHVPVGADDRDLVQDPMELFDSGQITDLTQAETRAIRDGADLAQVVNVRRKGAGLSEAGRVLERIGRLTPEGIYRIASDREEAIRLLLQFGYLTGRIGA